MVKYEILRILFMMAAACFALPSCDKPAGKLLEFDLAENYPEKEILLSDYFRTRYLPIMTDPVLLAYPEIIYASDNEYVGYDLDNLQIFFLDGEGKISRLIAKNGNGPGEYQDISSLCYEPATGELFILDADKQSILVLDKEGRYLRDFPAEIEHRDMEIMRNFDKDHLISYNLSGYDKKGGSAYHILSKSDGKVVKTVQLPLTPGRIPTIIHRNGNSVAIFTIPENRLTEARDYFLLNESSCDTIYKLTKKDNRLEPFLVKSPALVSMNEKQPVFLYAMLDAPGFLLLNSLKVFEQANGTPQYKGKTYLYDKKLKTIYSVRGRHENYVNAYDLSRFEYSEMPYGMYIKDLSPLKLLDNNEKGLLKDSLKELAFSLDEEDNPVLEILSLKNK